MATGMHRRDSIAIIVIALLARVAVAAFQAQPAYMDAYYYTVGAQRLAGGFGFTEPYVWNYLDDPATLPHPSHLYWMPLPSILGAASMAIFGITYRAAQAPFVLLSSALPLIAYAIAWRTTSRRRTAWLAALLMIFSGFYLPFWGVPESFTPYAVFGSLALFLAGIGSSKRTWLVAGACAGLAHLSRADGLLLLIPLMIATLRGADNTESLSEKATVLTTKTRPPEGGRRHQESPRFLRVPSCLGDSPAPPLRDSARPPWDAPDFPVGSRKGRVRRVAAGARRRGAGVVAGFQKASIDWVRSAFIRVYPRPLFLLLGYLVVMLPWFLRNIAVVGAPISPAGTQAVWLCSYDELFSFGVRLDASHLLGCGLDQLIAVKVRALGTGLVHLVAENGLVFLAPLIAIGLWRLRKNRLFQPAILYLVLLYLAMTLAFTFVGDRGGLFHSSAALMPFLCAAGPVGLDIVVGGIARRRQVWNVDAARRVFGVGVIGLAAVFSAAIAWGRVIGPDWNRADAAYREAGAWLAGQGDTASIVIAGNPPGFTYHTGHPSIVTPDGDVDTLLRAARRFGARWLLLDANRPEPLAGLYAEPSSDPRFKPASTFDGALIMEIVGR